jgi:putative CocE/NonD family hydrolase
MGGGSGRKNAAGRLDHGGAWRTAADWPLPGTRWEPWYLHADGSLSSAPPEVESAWREYRHDPANPVPTIGGTVTSGQPVMVGGAYDQREAPQFFGSTVLGRALADRDDVLVFQTPPLEGEVELTGPLVVNLWIASDCPDTDFTAKLVDVHPPSDDYPDGYAMNLTDGILRVRYRNSWERPELMTPGQVYEVTIEAFPTSNRFMPGHRIRLDIASSNFPHFDVNPNTGEPEGRATSMRVARNRIHLDQTRPSHAILPVIPARR